MTSKIYIKRCLGCGNEFFLDVKDCPCGFGVSIVIPKEKAHNG